MAEKHERAQIALENNIKTSTESSHITTGHQTSLQSLQAEITSLRVERDAYRGKYGKARTDVASLQARLDEVNDQVADLKRALQYTLEAGHLDRPKPKHPDQILSTPAPSNIVEEHDRSAQPEPNRQNDDEIEFVGISTSVKKSEVQDKAGAAPIKLSVSSVKHSIEHDRPSEVSEIENVGLSGDSRSAKRRKVEGSSVSRCTTSGNVGIERNSRESAVTSANSSIGPKESQPLEVVVCTSTPSQINPQSQTIEEEPVASSNIQLSTTSPNNANNSPHQLWIGTNTKIKEDALILSSSLASGYLNACKPLNITPPPSSLCVPRKFLRQMYGGSDQQFLQFISPTRNPSGRKKRRIVFPMIDINPSMPSAPGDPGLVYASRHEILEDPPWTLFCKDSAAKQAVWRYLGEYESELCGKMSAELFRSHPRAVRQAWGDSILKTKQWDIYVAMRARIALRKVDMPLQVEQVEEEIKNIRSNNGRPITVEDIMAALECGEEAVDIIKMQCVLYDHTFMEDMEMKFQLYSPTTPVRRRINQTTSIARRKSRAKKKIEGEQMDDADAGAKRTRQTKANDDMLEEDDTSYTSQFHGASSLETPAKRRTRSRWDALTGTRLPIPADDNKKLDEYGAMDLRP